MSTQFGTWNLDGKPIDIQYVEKVEETLVPYSPDGISRKLIGNIALLFGAFHTTAESSSTTQPHGGATGIEILFDGVLDNRSELIQQIGNSLNDTSTDSQIVAAAYKKWSTESFRRLLGDWALAIWDRNNQALFLAKDFLGTKALFYEATRNAITWSTLLDPLVLFHSGRLSVCEEYVAGWLTLFPDAKLSPYNEILAVPPAHFVRLSNGKTTLHCYWDPDTKPLFYRRDDEYEEHFRSVFSTAVCRKTRSDRPVLAELSGGIDSSSIVRTADWKGVGLGWVDTVSYFDDSEPNWDERPFFTMVEQARGRTGVHIDVAGQESVAFGSSGFMVAPGAKPPETVASRQLSALVKQANYRVLLSGIGGDEMTGGVPTPTPELQDSLRGCRFGLLAHQLTVWALNKRKPWIHLLNDAVREFFPRTLASFPEYSRPPVWLNSGFANRNLHALLGYPTRLTITGPSPTQQHTLATLDGLRRQLSSTPSISDPLLDRRYPYLDRDFVQFMLSVPRNQIVRPGHRRSLLRRALAGIVPDGVLNRRRKAYVSRGTSIAVAQDWPGLVERSREMICGKLAIVDCKLFLDAIQQLRDGFPIPQVPIMRLLTIEQWLRSIGSREILLDKDLGRTQPLVPVPVLSRAEPRL